MYKPIGIFKLIKEDSYNKERKCFCIGSDNCSDENCPLVKERLDRLEVEFLKDNICVEDQRHVDSVLDEFDVETEEELELKLIEESLTIPCIECNGKEFDINDLHWVHGDPYCGNHFKIEEDFYD